MPRRVAVLQYYFIPIVSRNIACPVAREWKTSKRFVSDDLLVGDGHSREPVQHVVTHAPVTRACVTDEKTYRNRVRDIDGFVIIRFGFEFLSV